MAANKRDALTEATAAFDPSEDGPLSRHRTCQRRWRCDNVICPRGGTTSAAVLEAALSALAAGSFLLVAVPLSTAPGSVARVKATTAEYTGRAAGCGGCGRIGRGEYHRVEHALHVMTTFRLWQQRAGTVATSSLNARRSACCFYCTI